MLTGVKTYCNFLYIYIYIYIYMYGLLGLLKVLPKINFDMEGIVRVVS